MDTNPTIDEPPEAARQGRTYRMEVADLIECARVTIGEPESQPNDANIPLGTQLLRHPFIVVGGSVAFDFIGSQDLKTEPVP